MDIIYNNISVTTKKYSDNNTQKKQQGIPEILQRIAALVILLILSPLLIASAMCILLESRGAIIFTQNRVGKNGQRFMMYKFRSMYCPEDPRYPDESQLVSDREGVCSKQFKDPRITSVGRIIRKLSIDELPQLLNVIKGDMLLVGPRPALPNETDQYSYKMLERLNVKAGLTGLWQVSGRADTSFEEQMDLDIRYVRERSILMDLYILLATVPVVIMGKGAY